jgi:hypothetical protein
MRRRGEGRIVNVSSITGDADGPMLGWYETTKRALTTLSDALRPELAAWGIDVVVVEPGPFSTPIWEKATARLHGRREGSAEPQVYERTIETIANLAARAGDAGEAAQLVGKVLRAVRPHFRYRVGAGAGLVAGLGRVVPTSVKDRLTPRGGGSLIATVARVIGAPPDAVAAVLADARSNDGVVVGSKRIRWFEARWPEPRTQFHRRRPTHSGDSILRGTLS